MNISEEKIRKVIKHYLVLEAFTVDEIPLIRMSDCNIQLPSTESGNAAELSKTANQIADLYGVPGSFCGVIAAMIPGASRERSARRQRQAEPQRQKQEAVFFASVRTELSSQSVLYLGDFGPTMTASAINDDTSAAAVNAAKLSFQRKLGEIAAIRMGAENDLEGSASKYVDDIFSGYGSTSDVKKSIRKFKEAGSTDFGIVGAMSEEAKRVMSDQAESEIRKARGHKHLTNTSVQRALDEYLSFVQEQ